MGLNRRDFLKTLGVAGSGIVGADMLHAAPKTEAKPEMFSILIDISRCEGCQSCEYACAEVNSLSEPEDYPDYIDVSPAGPAQINDYLKLGYIMLDL